MASSISTSISSRIPEPPTDSNPGNESSASRSSQERQISYRKAVETSPIFRPFHNAIFFHANMGQLLEINELAKFSTTCRLARFIQSHQPYFEDVTGPHSLPLTSASTARIVSPENQVRARFLEHRTRITPQVGELVKRYAKDRHLPLPPDFCHQHLYPFSDALVSMSCPPPRKIRTFLSYALTARHERRFLTPEQVIQRKKFENVSFLSFYRRLEADSEWQATTENGRLFARQMFPHLQRLYLDCNLATLAYTIDRAEWLPGLVSLTLKSCNSLNGEPEARPDESYPLKTLVFRNCYIIQENSLFKLFPQLESFRHFDDHMVGDLHERILTKKTLQGLREFCPNLKEMSVGVIDIRKLRDRELQIELSQVGLLSLDSLRKIFPPLAVVRDVLPQDDLRAGVVEDEGGEDELRLFQEHFGSQLHFTVHLLDSTHDSSGKIVKQDIWKRVEGFCPKGVLPSSSSSSSIDNQEEVDLVEE